ncbi:GGDEF domain-containing protein [Evansella sp. AB-rgal1]|uniref:GGDEF domain-containing protein n=1 Tax=Evansella sp. AB-rgal1 TaxID=3242696 RepID=UPI00359E6152
MKMINITNYDKISVQYEEAGQGRNALAFRLLEANRCYQEGLFFDAKKSLEKMFTLYKQYVDREPPLSVKLLFGNVLEKNGDLKQALDFFHEQFIKHDSFKAMIRMGYVSITIRDMSLIKQYEKDFLERCDSPTTSMNKKLHLLIILGYFYTYTGRDTSIVQEMIHYHKENSMMIREKLKGVEYVRWLYNLHILQFLNNRPWNERAQFIYEAEGLAEQYGETAMLMNIYNLMGIGLIEENVIKAKDYMIKSKNLAIALGNKQHEMNANTNLIMFYLYLGDTSYSIELGEKAKAIANAFKLNFNEITLVKLYYLIEDYSTALKLINEEKSKLRKNKLNLYRVDALIFQYKIILRQNNVKKAKRLWPFIEKIGRKYKGKMDLLLLQSQYCAVLKQYEKTISIATTCLKEENIGEENRLEFSIILLESFLRTDQDEAFTKYVQSFEEVVFNKGYFGYLGYVYFYKGLFYVKNKSYIQARVFFIRAKSYFTKVNNVLKQKEIGCNIEKIDNQSLKMTANKQLEMMNLLTNNEIMFNSIRLVHSAQHLEAVCKNITKVLHENMLFDSVYFHFRIDRSRNKTLHVNDKLQSEEIMNDNVDAVLKKVVEEKSVSQCGSGNSHYHGFPILSSENEVISVVLMENQHVLSGESIYYLDQFLQFISPKILNVIYNELVHVDGLTKLFNRNYFITRLNEEFQKTLDFQANLSFFMIDIDNFRYVNNQFGHTEGDRILEEVAATIQQSVRSSDIVGRYGGEELIVILPNTNSEIAKGVAHHILSEIRKIHVNESYHITASIGVSSVDKDNPATMQELIDKADFAERYAKEHGKNRVCCFWEVVSGGA